MPTDNGNGDDHGWWLAVAAWCGSNGDEQKWRKQQSLSSMSLVRIIVLSSSLRSVLVCEAAEAPDPVLDIDGKKLRAGVDYYILPIIRGRGGGLTLASPTGDTCPLSVIQEQLEVKHGLPLIFTPVNPKKDVVRVSTDLNIKFSASTICVESTVWKFEYDEILGQYFIYDGAVEGNPGRETVDNWFKIENFDDKDYKLVFCPTVCKFCKVICKDVGIFVQGGTRRLALSDVPLRIMFKKA
nr:kunitz trypsin inhibitor 2-like [Coffea arabica]